MNEISAAEGESSLLLWGLAFLVAGLSCHVCLAWVRRAQHPVSRRQRLGALLLAAATLGTGLCSSTVLALSAEALKFPIGYHTALVPQLWLLAMVASLLPLAWLAHSQRPLALCGCGLLVAALAAGLQAGWIQAAGFRPGPEWHANYAAAAGLLEVIGFSVVMWMGFANAVQTSGRRVLWRAGAAVAMALTLVAGQLLLGAAARLFGQRSSVYLDEVPASALSLVCGVLVPLVLVGMTVDLAVRKARRRKRRRRRSVGGKSGTGGSTSG